MQVHYFKIEYIKMICYNHEKEKIYMEYMSKEKFEEAEKVEKLRNKMLK